MSRNLNYWQYRQHTYEQYRRVAGALMSAGRTGMARRAARAYIARMKHLDSAIAGWHQQWR